MEMQKLKDSENNNGWGLWAMRCILCWQEGKWCYCCYRCCPDGGKQMLLSAPKKRPDIQHVFQSTSTNDCDTGSTSSLLKYQSITSSPTSSLSSVKDLKSDIYHQIELRRSSCNASKKLPLIDVKPIEFWSGVKGEGVQPPNLPAVPTWKDKKAAESQTLMKKSLLKIRPHLYASTSSSLEESAEEEEQAEILGRLHFSFHYDPLETTLLVRLPYSDLIKRTLELKVKDFDKFSRNCVVGVVRLPLNCVSLTRPCRMWRPISPFSSDEDTLELGELLLSLNFLPNAGRLNVDIVRGRQLLRTSVGRGADSYVRVSLVMAGRHLKSKKTSVKKNSLDPSFNESFSFHVTTGELQDVSLVVSLWDSNGGVVRDEFIGRIVVGKDSTGPCETSHWEGVVMSPRQSIAKWHMIKSRDHCDKVSPASRLVP